MRNRFARAISALFLILNPKKFLEILRFAHRTKCEEGWKVSYSQHAEDLAFLSCFFRDKPNVYMGRYLDIGAHHPTRFSNTYLLYTMGWRGVNVEANPALFPIIARERPLDVNLNCAVATGGEATLYLSSKSAMSTTSESVARVLEYAELGRLVGKVNVPAISLQEILDSYFPNKGPDLMSIDIEGSELEALKSGSLSSLPCGRMPEWILIETNVPVRSALAETSIRYLKSLKYEPELVLPRSSLLRRTKFNGRV